MIENIIDHVSNYVLNHQGTFEYIQFGVIAALFPAAVYEAYKSFKEQKKLDRAILSNKDVECLTWLKEKGIVTIDEDKLKPYDLERLASTTWSKEEGIVRVKS